VSQLKRLRCEIVGIVQPDGEPTEWFAVETFRETFRDDETFGDDWPNNRRDRTDVCVTAFIGEPTAAEKASPELADNPDTKLDLPFGSVRGLATALLRAYYHEVPASTSRVPVEDLVEHFTHLDEVLRGAVHDPKVTDIANAIELERERNDALRDVGRGRKRLRYWQARYQHAAEWGVHNAAKVAALRAAVRILTGKLADREGDRKRLEEMTWLLTHEPPDDLGGMTQALRRKWCERRDAALGPKADSEGPFVGSYRGTDIRKMAAGELRMALADIGGQLRAALAAKEEPGGHPG